MKIYLVGGAVRDQLLGLPVHERDWVVVGATPAQMFDLGYAQVGRDFPVFIHPKTGDEYALARTERKIGKGYTGFECYAEPTVTLEEDLLRRDLTINAIAMDEDGKITDPYGGQNDLNNKILRHVSDAFSEDPLRVLRVARFSAKLPDFSIAEDTQQLLITIVNNGEIPSIASERVWAEFEKAFRQAKPSRYFSILHECGALKQLLEPFDHLYSEQGNDAFYAKKYIAQATLDAIDYAHEQYTRTDFNNSTLIYLEFYNDTFPKKDIMMSLLFSDIRNKNAKSNKGDSVSDDDIQSIKTILKHYHAPRNQMILCALLPKWYHWVLFKFDDAKTIMDLFLNMDAFRRPSIFYACMDACRMIYLSRFGGTNCEGVNLIVDVFKEVKKITPQIFIEQGLEGEAIKTALQDKRQSVIKQFLKNK